MGTPGAGAGRGRAAVTKASPSHKQPPRPRLPDPSLALIGRSSCPSAPPPSPGLQQLRPPCRAPPAPSPAPAAPPGRCSRWRGPLPLPLSPRASRVPGRPPLPLPLRTAAAAMPPPAPGARLRLLAAAALAGLAVISRGTAAPGRGSGRRVPGGTGLGAHPRVGKGTPLDAAGWARARVPPGAGKGVLGAWIGAGGGPVWGRVPAPGGGRATEGRGHWPRRGGGGEHRGVRPRVREGVRR